MKNRYYYNIAHFLKKTRNGDIDGDTDLALLLLKALKACDTTTLEMYELILPPRFPNDKAAWSEANVKRRSVERNRQRSYSEKALKAVGSYE